MTTPTPPRYAGLDGLRAIAVLLVVVYHLFPTWFVQSGFVGVDVFFVISGFLITSLLLREHRETGRIGLRAFWTRRARRLLPALALLVTVCSTAAWLVGGDVLVGLGRQVLGAATFSYNWLAISDGASYFSGAEPEVFRNLWSLAVEEQFYVLWPLLLPLLLLLPGRRRRAALAALLAAGSAAWAVGLMSTGATLTRAYYGTDTHAFGLLLGVALAVWRFGRAAPRPSIGGVGPVWGLVVGVAALGALTVVASLVGGETAYPLVPLAASALTALIIAVAVPVGSWFGRALDIAPLRWIGARSYGIYLWHWPVVVLLAAAVTGSFAEESIPIGVGIAAALVTLAVSAASYRWLEQPIRQRGFAGALRALRGRFGADPVRRFGAITAVTVGALVIGGTTAAVAAAPRETSSEAAVQAGIDALAEASASPTPAPTDVSPTPTATDAVTPAPSTSTPPPRDGRPQPPAPTTVDGSRISAIGDSVMLASAPGLLAKRPGIQIDAEVSRSMWAGIGVAQSWAGAGALREYVVVGLGTNGPVDADELQSLYDALGPGHSLVLVNAFAPRDWIPGVNEQLAAFAASHPGVVAADWSSAIAPHLDLLAGDQIHPGPTGGSVYADTVAAAVDGIENQRAQVRYEVELIQWATERALAPSAS